MNPKLKTVLERHGVDAQLLTRNGPRLYIHRIRGRLSLVDGALHTEKVYLDMEQWKPVVRVDAPRMSAAERQRRQEEIAERVQPLARLLRMKKVQPTHYDQ